jgi:hypothetical protein
MNSDQDADHGLRGCAIESVDPSRSGETVDANLLLDAVVPLEALEVVDRDVLNLNMLRHDRRNSGPAHLVRSGGVGMPPDCTEDDLEKLGFHRRELFLNRMQTAIPGSQIKLESQPELQPESQPTPTFQSGHHSDAGGECES